MVTTTSTKARQSHPVSELDKFKLFYEFVPVQKASGRVKRTHASAA